jgi:hypothetical protein
MKLDQQQVPPIDSLPPSTSLGLRCPHAVLKILSQSDGFVAPQELLERVAATVSLSEWDTANTKGGNFRWHNQLAFHSLYAVKAGLLEKDRRRGWRATDAGKRLARLGGQTLFDAYWNHRLEYEREKRKWSRRDRRASQA